MIVVSKAILVKSQAKRPSACTREAPPAHPYFIGASKWQPDGIDSALHDHHEMALSRGMPWDEDFNESAGGTSLPVISQSSIR
ncbi:hypothetical protein SAMN05445504_9201 [Burkholderia sp. CF099]|nr:hypothetical protein SAMN05445504_9201 [Burkholderia sp. CF099]